MSDPTPEQLAALRLIRSEGIGPVSYRHLLRRCGSAQAALAALPRLARQPRRVAGPADALAEWHSVARAGGRLLFLDDAGYPRALAEIDDPPPVLALRGNAALLARPCVAFVGARNASAAAQRFARDLAHEAAGHGLVVVSGLARGIDAAAHRGALEGGTIGVIAGGVDTVYPPENAALHQQLYEQGLVVAEQPPGTEPQARHFPRRNRIISGLVRGVVVVEAALRSGSLITARLAAEQGREVMAVPGSPLDPRAQGCNQLIRDGATLVQSIDDICEALGSLGRPGLAHRPAVFEAGAEPDPPPVAGLLDLLGATPVALDDLVRLSGQSAAAVQTSLVDLELSGLLVRHAGGRVALAA